MPALTVPAIASASRSSENRSSDRIRLPLFPTQDDRHFCLVSV